MEQKNYFDRQNRLIGNDTTNKVKDTSVLVIGAGAGGNEILKDLALMGFGKITIIDFDHIEASNLSRTVLFRKTDLGKSKALTAAERLKELALHQSPDIRGLHGNIISDIGKGVFFDHDIVLSCVDQNTARIYINDCCMALSTPFFEAGFNGFALDISFFVPGEDNPCLRSVLGQGPFDDLRNSCSGLKIRDDDLEHIPTIQSISALTASIISVEIVKFLNGTSSLRNKSLLYHGNTHKILIVDRERSKDCTAHERIDESLVEIDMNNQVSVKEFIERLNGKFDNNFILALPEKFIESWRCVKCDKEIKVNKRESVIFDDERWCSTCRPQADFTEEDSTADRIFSSWKSINEIHLSGDMYSGYYDKKLKELGIPPRDILTIQGIESPVFYNILLRD